ncbi:MAG: hypothetical protein JNK65_08610 [Deltaproteobacteria bacterium]|nr:hypothetical protein [Deltaproteobacteria bacterium]
MGPTLTIPMDGSFRLKILANQDHLLPIIDEVRALNLGGASLSVNTQYKESQITIHREDGKKIAIFRYAIDSDDESTNGRIYVEDHFVLDEHKKLVDFQRSLSAGPGSLKQDFWFHLLKRLNQKKIPTKDQNSVQRFFQNVVLKLPEAPPEEKKKIDFVSLNAKVALPEHATFVFKTPLENTFYSRLSLSLSKTLSLFSWNSRELDLFAKGFVYNTKGWSEENPYYQLLLVEGKLNPDQTKLVEGFNRLSTGDWQAAKQQWELIRMRVPVANELLFTLREYEQAQKNLGYLPILKNLSLEALDLQRKKEGGGFFANLSPSFSVSLEFLNTLFTHLENQISSGKSISLDQAFSQIFNEANPAERAQLNHLKSAQFAQGMFSQLLQASALPSDFFAQILSSFAKETMTGYGYLSTQALSFNYLASHPLERFSQKLVEVPVGMESFASSWMQSHDLRLAYDQTFAASQKFIADPSNLAAFLLGQGAFGMGQNVGIASWGTRSAQTRLFNALLGLSLEVPTFEITSRGLHQMFVEKVSWEDLDQALFKGFLSFSALRGLGSLQSKNAAALLQQSPQELKPLLPFFAQVHSFGILHGLNQFERALMKDPTFENPYTSLMDASFFAHAGLSHQVGEKIWGYNLLKGSDAIFRVDRIRKLFNSKNKKIT